MEMKEFAEAVNRHDLTYKFSDDGKKYSAGRASLHQITAAARGLEPEVVAKIWNEMVDKKVRPEHRDAWYWAETEQQEG